MPFDPDIRRYLDAAVATGTAPFSEIGVEEARRWSTEEILATLGEPEAVGEVLDTEAPGPAGPVPLTVYRPDNVEQSGPSLLFLHGGGWVIGSRRSHDPICRAIAVMAGITVISAEYRLAPEAPVPAAIEDCVAAFRWIASAAETIGVDSERVCIGGDSAGGNLAAVTAIRTRQDPVRPRGQLLIYPVTDARGNTSSYKEHADGYGLTPEDMEWFLGLYLGNANVLDWRVSPIRTVDLSGLAPAVVITAEYDILRDEGEAYAKALADAGVRVHQWRAAGMPHAFLNYRAVSPAAAAAYRMIADQLTLLL